NQVVRYLADHRSRWLDSMHVWLLRDTPHVRDRYSREITTTMLGLRDAPPGRALGGVERAALAKLRLTFAAALPGDRKQADALLDAVYEHPDDDVRRALLADFLLSRDEHDPRGEFINLQLRAAAGPLPEPARARERELLDLHGFRWLGPLVSTCYPSTVRFARGFLVEIALRPYFRASEVELGAPGHPIWATVEALEGCSVAMIRDPVMRSLRTLRCGLDCAETLLRGPARPKLEALWVTVSWSPTRNPQGHALDRATVLALALELLAKLDGAPNLRHLRLRDQIAADPSAWCWIWQGPRAQLESVRLRVVDEELRLSAWAQQLRDDGARVELSLDYGMLCFTLRPIDGYRTLRVIEGEPYWRAEDKLALEWITKQIAPALRTGGLRRIEVGKTIIDAERLRAELDDDTLEIVAV
ncbi:MAG TPA: TIGR02996 domain-containing protein, partial [Enhygromyxa sp.]|nr:TIGR02996 domain-containing protein [Enhygromyxa sp.]